MTTTSAPTVEDLNRIAVQRIIARAAALANDPDLNKRRDVYEPAKWAIRCFFTSTSDEYRQAIEQLTKEMKI